MGPFKNLFGAKPPPLPPLADPILGELRWNGDSEGWEGSMNVAQREVHLYLGAGTAQEYPSAEIRALLAAPKLKMKIVALQAIAYLHQNEAHLDWKVNPSGYELDGLESYQHYLSEGTFTVTFVNGDTESVWRVNFQGEKPVGWGVDD